VSTAAIIFLIVGGVLLILAAILVPLVVLLRRGGRRAEQQLAADQAAGPTLRGPEAALYQGGDGDFPRVSGNGTALLTSERFSFRIKIGKDVEVRLTDVLDIHTARSFQRRVRAGATFVVLRTAAGEAGFIFSDSEVWAAALRDAVAVASPGAP